MNEDRFVRLITSILNGDIETIFKTMPIEINIQRHSVSEYYEQDFMGGRRERDWGLAMVGFNASVPQMANFIANGDPFIFVDLDYAYAAYLIAELKAQAFLKYRDNLLIATEPSNIEIDLIRRLDSLREFLYADASSGFERYSKIANAERSDNAFISPFASSTINGLGNHTLVFKPYADKLMGGPVKGQITKSGGWI